MPSPIDYLMDSLEWTPVPDQQRAQAESNLPYATHRGVLTIGDMSLGCYRLNTGQAVIDGDDMQKYFREWLR